MMSYLFEREILMNLNWWNERQGQFKSELLIEYNTPSIICVVPIYSPSIFAGHGIKLIG